MFVGAVVILLLSAITVEGSHPAFHYLTLSSSSTHTSTSWCAPIGGGGIDFASSIQGGRRRRRRISHSSHRHHCTTVPTTTTLMMTLDEIPNYETTTANNNTAADSNKKGTVLYNVTNSGWKSPQWNWGSARGTGHDCASICRSRWSDREDRRILVHSLLLPSPVSSYASNNNGEVSFEEIKLILALAWQRGRWDGTDGGPNGYRSVLQTMVDAHQYENENEIISSLHFIEDITSKYHSISRNAKDLHKMKDIANTIVHGKKKHASMEEIFMARRMCAGMVLDAMHFVDNGL